MHYHPWRGVTMCQMTLSPRPPLRQHLTDQVKDLTLPSVEMSQTELKNTAMRDQNHRHRERLSRHHARDLRLQVRPAHPDPPLSHPCAMIERLLDWTRNDLSPTCRPSQAQFLNNLSLEGHPPTSIPQLQYERSPLRSPR